MYFSVPALLVKFDLDSVHFVFTLNQLANHTVLTASSRKRVFVRDFVRPLVEDNAFFGITFDLPGIF